VRPAYLSLSPLRRNSPGRQYDADAAIALDDCKNGNTAGHPVWKLLESGSRCPSHAIVDALDAGLARAQSLEVSA
jgi:hypothetical protein